MRIRIGGPVVSPNRTRALQSRAAGGFRRQLGARPALESPATLQARLVGCVLLTGWFVHSLSAADPSGGDRPAGVAAASPNAAVIYWQAFAALPTLEGDHKTKYEAATKTTNEPVNADLGPTVALFETALRELLRARSVAPCDWNLNYDDGAELRLSHLQKARDLSRAALLRARLRFAAGEIDLAVADVMAVLKMARDCGVSPLLVALLVDAALENQAADVLAANLSRLQPEQLDRLATALQQLPPTATLADGLRLEGRAFGDWFERLVQAEAAKLNDPQAGGQALVALAKSHSVELGLPANATDAQGTRARELVSSLSMADVHESLRQLRSDYENIAQIATLHVPDRAARWAEFGEKLAAGKKEFEAKLASGQMPAPAEWKRLFSYTVMPAISKVAERERQLYVRRSLLALAVQVQRHGSDVLKSTPAFDGGTVEHQKTDTGFELHYRAQPTDKAEVLQVPPHL